jgi:type II secretory pathway component PulM
MWKVGRKKGVETGLIIEMSGKTFVSVPISAQIRQGVSSSWIWHHGRELRLLAGSTPKKCWQCTYCGVIRPVDSTTFHAETHLQKSHQLTRDGEDNLPEDHPP